MNNCQHLTTRLALCHARNNIFGLGCGRSSTFSNFCNGSNLLQVCSQSGYLCPVASYWRSVLLDIARQRTMAKRINYDIAPKLNDQKFHYFLVLDFEATCDNKRQLQPQEVIEFPVLKVNARSQKIESSFHQYVLPQYYPQLTSFCTELTGIVQDMVSGQPHLPYVLQSFDNWMMSEGLLSPEVKSIFVTCGDWDLKTMLPRQCAYLGIAPRIYFQRWINIKKSFAEVTGLFPKGMMDMLTHFGLKHKGRLHSGIDDCHNISNILTELLKQGYVFEENGHL